MARPKLPDDERKSVPLMVRMPNHLLDRIDRYMESLKKDKSHAGINITRSDAVRVLVTKALDSAA